MSPNHLRVYNGPQEEPATVSVTESQAQRQTVTVPLLDVLPLLADAVQSERTWLRDFADDEVTILDRSLRSPPGLPALPSPLGLSAFPASASAADIQIFRMLTRSPVRKAPGCFCWVGVGPTDAGPYRQLRL